MSSHWTFFTFDPARFRRESCDPATGIANVTSWLTGKEATCPESKLLTAANLERLADHDLDYNILPRKYWKVLDAYYRLSFRELLDAAPESKQPAARHHWEELLRFYRSRNGRDTATFAALADTGLRPGLQPRPESWRDKLAAALYGAPCDFLILDGEELHTFCRHLQALFYVNSWDWPTTMEEQEVLRPHFVRPFLHARDGTGALYARRCEAGAPVVLKETTTKVKELLF